MLESEKIIIQIGEFVYTELDEVNRIEYTKEKNILIAFAIVMENGKQYSIEVKEKV